MNKGKYSGLTGLWILMLAVWACGVVMTVTAPFYWADLRDRVARKTAELQKVRELQQLAARQEEVVAAFEQLPSPRAQPLIEEIRRVLPGIEYEIRPGDSQGVGDAWTLQTATLAFREIGYDDLISLCLALETSRPPWRITGIHLQAGRQERQAQTATLALETLEKVATRP